MSRRILGLIVINLIVIIGLSIMAPYFLTRANIAVIIDNMALEAIVLSAYVLLLIGGHFDLSVDGVVALTGIITGISINRGVPWPAACVVGLLLAGSIGFFNGFIVNKLQINGLIATLATLMICVGISFGITKAIAPYGFPDTFQAMAQTRVFGFRVIVFYALVIATVSAIVLDRTKIGAHIYSMGDNRTAAELMGVRVDRTGIGLYILLGLAAGFIGLLSASRLDAASPVAVDGLALRVIAAGVMGGANLSGGKGSVIGGLLGLLLMGLLGNAIIQLGVSPYWQKAVLGSVLLVAVLSDRLKFHRSK